MIQQTPVYLQNIHLLSGCISSQIASFTPYYGIEAYVGSSMESEKDDGCVFPICYDENHS